MSRVFYKLFLISIAPIFLEALGWKKSKEYKGRWVDPNNKSGMPQFTHYAWYVSRLRVQNRTDTKTIKLTNSDLAKLS